MTPTTITGAGIQVTMTNIEVVRIDALEGNDTFVVQGTAPTVATYVYGGLGSDTFDLGLNGDVSQIQGALLVSGGDDPASPPAFPAPILLPGESTGPLPAAVEPEPEHDRGEPGRHAERGRQRRHVEPDRRR